jgi:hypothetical protein
MFFSSHFSTSVASPGEYNFLGNGRNDDEIRSCYFDLEEDATAIRIVRLKECLKPGVTERMCVAPICEFQCLVFTCPNRFFSADIDYVKCKIVGDNLV